MTDSRAAHALRLRGWTLRLLAGGGPAAAGPPPAVTAAAWDVFLRGERCALPLRAALGPDGASALPPEGAGQVEARASREAQRGLAGRAQLRGLGRLLAERGWTGIVLKGGAMLAAGEVRVDVGDIDLLLPPEQAFQLVRLLDAGGASATDPDPWEHSTQDFHLAPRTGHDQLPLEVHFRIPFAVGVDPWRAPLPSGTPGIARLAPADHLWHVLVHCVEHHLERRGMIRDLVLLRGALDACTPDDEASVARRAAAHGSAAALTAMLRMARALAHGQAPGDPFPQAAALRYLLASGAAPFAPATPRGLETTSAAAALVSGMYLRRWFGEPSSVLTLPSARGSRWLDQRIPLLALPARAAWRGTRLALVTLPALRLARAARRLAAAAG